jgi:hypothetical protein
MAITIDDLFDAFNDALARIHEFDGGGVDAKLAAFGLDAEAVRQLLEDRWLAHGKDLDGEAGHRLFVQGFVEGLVTGMQLRQIRDEGYL